MWISLFGIVTAVAVVLCIATVATQSRREKDNLRTY